MVLEEATVEDLENLLLDLEEVEGLKEEDLQEVKEEINIQIIVVTFLEGDLEDLEDVNTFLINKKNKFFILIYFNLLDRSKFDTTDTGVLNSNTII